MVIKKSLFIIFTVTAFSIVLAQVPSSIKIMFIGDSITEGHSFNYRYFFYHHLIDNGYTFVEADGVWYTQLYVLEGNEKIGTTINFPLRFDPISTLNVSLVGDFKETILESEEVFLTMDPNASSIISLGHIEMANLLGQRYRIFNIKTQGAYTEYVGDDILVMNCDDANETTTVIYAKVSDRDWVSIDGGCVTIEGRTEWDVVRAEERLIYDLVGVV